MLLVPHCPVPRDVSLGFLKKGIYTCISHGQVCRQLKTVVYQFSEIPKGISEPKQNFID
jgi:hypothetical protein